jgi:hypothetical protein
MPDMTVIAETDLPTGCDTSLETVHRDGHRDVGGMAVVRLILAGASTLTRAGVSGPAARGRPV